VSVHRRACIVVVAALAVGATAITSCGSSKSDPEPVQARPLLAECTVGAIPVEGTPAIGEPAVLAWRTPKGEEGCPTGPAADGDGPLFTNAETHTVNGDVVVDARFVEGAASAFNALAAACAVLDAGCPTGKIAIVVNGRVLSIATLPAVGFADTVQFLFQDSSDACAFSEAVNRGR
jgi:hypothetical protein